MLLGHNLRRRKRRGKERCTAGVRWRMWRPAQIVRPWYVNTTGIARTVSPIPFDSSANRAGMRIGPCAVALSAAGDVTRGMATRQAGYEPVEVLALLGSASVFGSVGLRGVGGLRSGRDRLGSAGPKRS